MEPFYVPCFFVTAVVIQYLLHTRYRLQATDFDETKKDRRKILIRVFQI